MNTRIAGDFDHETNGTGYAVQRRTDPRIAAYVHTALAPAGVRVGPACSASPRPADTTRCKSGAGRECGS